MDIDKKNPIYISSFQSFRSFLSFYYRSSLLFKDFFTCFGFEYKNLMYHLDHLLENKLLGIECFDTNLEENKVVLVIYGMNFKENLNKRYVCMVQ
jgi:hypothetical protein